MISPLNVFKVNIDPKILFPRFKLTEPTESFHNVDYFLNTPKY